MTIRKTFDPNQPVSAEELEMLKNAAKMPVTFDEDSPELTPDELKEMRRISEQRSAERRKQTVTIRLSPQALRTAQSLGKGYTSVLSRILESALSDSETIKQYL